MTLIKFKNNSNFPMLAREFGFPTFFTETVERVFNDEDIRWMPSANVTENQGNYLIDLAVPGMSKNDIKIEVESGVLTVSGERQESQENKDGKSTRREFHYGAFRRTFNLPESVDEESIHATCKDGILTLTLNKKGEPAKPAKKQITIE